MSKALTQNTEQLSRVASFDLFLMQGQSAQLDAAIEAELERRSREGAEHVSDGQQVAEFVATTLTL